jgi:hypothetical protein
MAAAASTSPRSAACGVAGSEGLGELGPPNAAREPVLRGRRLAPPPRKSNVRTSSGYDIVS